MPANSIFIDRTLEMDFGSPGDTSWGMEKAWFWRGPEKRPGRQPLWFERHLGARLWRPGGITLEMGLGRPGGTSWGMEKAGFSEARLTGARQQPLSHPAVLKKGF